VAVFQAETDVLIFGAGGAGLWTAAKLRSAGYSCVLLESDAIGGGQSILCQGIIHGGIKYAITEGAPSSSDAISAMPAIWQRCFDGQGEIDLRRVRILSPYHYIWPAPGFAAGLKSAIASKLMNSACEPVPKAETPEAFLRSTPRPAVHRVRENVAGMSSLLGEMAAAAGAPVLRLDGPGAFEIRGRDEIEARCGGHAIRLRFRFIVLTAGQGNEDLITRLDGIRPAFHLHPPRMQLRPLHMVAVRGPRGSLPPVYGHCIGNSTTPLVTITTHSTPEGGDIWYLGGGVAEHGVQLARAEQVEAARDALRRSIRFIDWARRDFEWITVRCQRAEGRTSDGSRPAVPAVATCEGAAVVWPTKLTFAPRVASSVLRILEEQGIPPGGGDAGAALAGAPRAAVAPLPWERRPAP
jgi:glycine/D-amino acid oxidase-like deaminating enzyme